MSLEHIHNVCLSMNKTAVTFIAAVIVDTTNHTPRLDYRSIIGNGISCFNARSMSAFANIDHFM